MAGGEIALTLRITCSPHARRHGGGRLGRRWRDLLGGADRRYIDAQIDTIEERTRHTALVFGTTRVAALAGVTGRPGAPTAAGVHRGDQLEARRESDPRIG